MIATILQLIQQLSSIIMNTQLEFLTIGALAVIMILSLVRLHKAKTSIIQEEKELVYNH